mgnify:CR=1 FL=1
MENRRKNGVFEAIRMAAVTHRLLTAGTILCAAASVAASLVPPLLLARIIDGLTAGLPLTFPAVLLYFGSLALEGILSSAQESLLVLFGQKMTHALRSEMSRKLTKLPTGTLAGQNPGEVAARFSGDVDTVEALFTSGIISMVADACRILSVMAVIAVKNTGLALILLLVLPLFAVFTRHVQTRMLAAQLDNRRAVAAVSGQVPETLHNIRTIRALGLEDYMERRYDRCIGESYAAMERTNFYDAIYSPVVLVLNAAVVGIVMLLSASGNAAALTLFGMSVGTSVAVINYISRIFAPIESLAWRYRPSSRRWRASGASTPSLTSRNAPSKERETSARAMWCSLMCLRLRRKARLERFFHDRQAGRAGDAGGPDGCRKEHSLQAAAGTLSPGNRVGDHRRRGRGRHHGRRAPHLHRLCGAAFCPCAGYGAGTDHAGRPRHHRRDGKERREACRSGCRHPDPAERL